MTSFKSIRRALPVLAALFALGITAPAFAPSAFAQTSTMAPTKPAKVKKSKKTTSTPATSTTAAAPAAGGGAMGAMGAMKSKMSSKASTSKTSSGRFTSEAEAKASCPSDTIVWASSKSKAYHLAGSKLYGKTKSGAYECKGTADSAGYHAAKN